jgi:methanol metabolism-related c-type cytochrome
VAALPHFAGAAGIALLAMAGIAYADGAGDPKAASEQDGKWLDKNGTPTFHIEGKKVDFYTYEGYLRYSENCLRCHGPDGLGSTYAPSLVDSLQHMSYQDFVGIVSGGKQDVTAAQTLVMPALGTNRNVMCYIDAIYVYLRARSDEALGRERPQEHDPKPAAFKEAENQCMG